MIRIAYNRRYNIAFLGLERFHPFDSRKYGRAWKQLRRKFGRTLLKYHVPVPRPVNRLELMTVHTTGYLRRLRNSAYLAQALELPFLRYFPSWLIDWLVLRPMRWATMGSVIAARTAIADGLAVNLSGGYHHAKPDEGEGFCIYSDIAFIVSSLRSEKLLAENDRVAYVDLDAHQGNGVCHEFMDDRRVFLFDMYNASIYPAYDVQARERIDCKVPLPANCTGTEYLGILGQRLPGFLDSLQRTGTIGLAIYNAGTDVFEGDPLGQLSLRAAQVLERDLYVVAELRRRQIPTVMLLSGGYTRQSYELVADSVGALLEEYGEKANEHVAVNSLEC
jgi:histone deacetylase 11